MGDVSGQKGTPTIATKVHSSPCQSHHEAYHSAPAGPPKAFRATGSAFSLLRQMEQDGESFTLIREIFLEGDLSGYYSLWYARAMQHGSTGFTGPLGCRRGAKMGSAPARATHAGLRSQPAYSTRRGGRLGEPTSRRRSKQRIIELQNRERRIRDGAGEFLARASTGGSTGERSCGKTVQISKLACNSHKPA